MNKSDAEIRINDALFGVLSLLPRGICSEILRICRLRRDFPAGLCEIRIRCGARSSLVISGENVPLYTRVSPEQLASCYDKALGGSLYSHIDEVKNGFISMPLGVRVGISGSAVDKDSPPTDITSLVFRLPSSRSENAGAIFSLWNEAGRGGMLIFSAPGAGKTSALRALSAIISRELLLRVVVIDERREFIPEEYGDLTVDVLRGFNKARGIEIAMRSLCPEVLIVDEIGSASESEALIDVGRGGVPIIATAHADSIDEALGKSSVRTLFELGYFSLFIRLYRKGGSFGLESFVKNASDSARKSVGASPEI